MASQHMNADGSTSASGGGEDGLGRLLASVAHTDPLASYGIIRVRPMSAVESACGCRPCIAATPLSNNNAAAKNNNAENNNNSSDKLTSSPSLSSAGSMADSAAAFNRRARRTMSVFSHAPTIAVKGGANRVAHKNSNAGDSDEDNDDDNDDDNPLKLQHRLLGVSAKKDDDATKKNQSSANEGSGGVAAGVLWREEWVDPSLAADAPDAASSDIQFSATIQRTSPATGGIDAHTFRLTHCLAPERVAVPVVNVPPGTATLNNDDKNNTIDNNNKDADASANTSSSSSSVKNQQTAILYAHPTQQQVFDTFGPSVIQGALRGQRQVVVVYGATGTGKTYTTWGTNNEQGIVPLILRGLVARFAADNAHNGKNDARSRVGGAALNEQVLKGRGKLKEILVSMFDINANEKVTDLLKLRLMDDEITSIKLATAAADVIKTSSATTIHNEQQQNAAGGPSLGGRNAKNKEIHAIVEQLSTIGVGTCPDDLNSTLEILRAALSIRSTKQHIKHAYGMRQGVDNAAVIVPLLLSSNGTVSSSSSSDASSSALEQPLDLLEAIANGNPYLQNTSSNQQQQQPASSSSGSVNRNGGGGMFNRFGGNNNNTAAYDANQPAASPAHLESTLTTVIRIEVLVSGGKTTVSAPLFGGGGASASAGKATGGSTSGASAVTTLSTIEADDLMGRIDIVECAGSEWLAMPPEMSASLSRAQRLGSGAQQQQGNLMAAAVRGSATEATPTSLLVTPTESQGIPTVTEMPVSIAAIGDGDVDMTEEERRRTMASSAANNAGPRPLFASLRLLHRSLLLLAATTGNAKQQATAIQDALGGSLLTEYLSDVLNPATATNPSKASSPQSKESKRKSPPKPFNGRLFFIGTVSGADGNGIFDQTVDTLRIADGVTRIGTFPTAKRDRKLEHAAELKEQIEKAKRQLAAIDEAIAVRKYGGGGGGGVASMTSSQQQQQGTNSSSGLGGADTESVLAKVTILRNLAKATERYQELTRNQEERSRWLQAARQRIHLLMIEKTIEYQTVLNEIAIMQTALMAGWPQGGGGSGGFMSAAPVSPFSINSNNNQSSGGATSFIDSLQHLVQRYSHQIVGREAAATASTAPSLIQMLKSRRLTLHPSSLLFRIGGLSYVSMTDNTAAANMAALLSLFQTTYGGNSGVGGGGGKFSADPNASGAVGFGTPSNHSATASMAGSMSGGGGGNVTIGSGGRRRNANAMIATGNAIMYGTANNNNNGAEQQANENNKDASSSSKNPLLSRARVAIKTPSLLLQQAVPPLVIEVLQTIITGVRCGALAVQVLQAAQKLQALREHQLQQAFIQRQQDETYHYSGGGGGDNGLVVTPPTSPRGSISFGLPTAADEIVGGGGGLLSQQRVFSNVKALPKLGAVPLAQLALFTDQLTTSASHLTHTPLLVCLNPTTVVPNSNSNSNNGQGAPAANSDNSGPLTLSTAGCFVSLAPTTTSQISEISTALVTKASSDTPTTASNAAASATSPSAAYLIKQPILLPPFFALREGGTSLGSFATAPRSSALSALLNGGGIGETDSGSSAAMDDAISITELQQQIVSDQQAQCYFSANTNGTSTNTIHSRIALPIDALNSGKKLNNSGGGGSNSSSVSDFASSANLAPTPAALLASSSIPLLFANDTVVARLDVDVLRQEVRLWTISSRDNLMANSESSFLKQQTAYNYNKQQSSASNSSPSKAGGGRKGVTFSGDARGGGNSQQPAQTLIPPDIEVTVNGVPLKAITVQPSSKKSNSAGAKPLVSKNPNATAALKERQAAENAESPAMDEGNFMSKDGYLLRHRDRIVIGNVAFQLLLPATWEAVKNGIEAPPLIPADPDPFLMIAQAATNASIAAEKKRRKQLEKLIEQQQELQRQQAGDGSGIPAGAALKSPIIGVGGFTDHQALVLDQLARAAQAFCDRVPSIGTPSPPKIATTTICTVNNKLGGKKEIKSVTEVLGPNEEPRSTNLPLETAVPDGAANALNTKRNSIDMSGSAGTEALLAQLKKEREKEDADKNSGMVPVNGVHANVAAFVLPSSLPSLPSIIVDNVAKQPVHFVPTPAIAMTATRRLVPMLFQRGHNGKAYAAGASGSGPTVTSSTTTTMPSSNELKPLTPEIATKLFDGSRGKGGNNPFDAIADQAVKPLQLAAIQAADPAAIPQKVQDHLKVCEEAVNLLKNTNTKEGFANPSLLLPKAAGDTKTAIKLNAANGIETTTVTMTTPVPPVTGSAANNSIVSKEDPAVAQALDLIKRIRRARGDDAADAITAQHAQLANAIAAVANASATSNGSPYGGLNNMFGNGANLITTLTAMGVAMPMPYSMGTLSGMHSLRQALLIESYERQLIHLLEACWFYEKVSNAKTALQAMFEAQQIKKTQNNNSASSSSSSYAKSRMGSSIHNNHNVSLLTTASNAANCMRFKSFATETVFRLSHIENQLITEFPNEKAVANVAIGGPADRLALFSFEGGDISDPRSLIRYQEMVLNKAIEAEKNKVVINPSTALEGPKKKKTSSSRSAKTNEETDATGLPKWVSQTGGAPSILSTTEAFEKAIIESRRFGDAELLKRLLEQSEMLRRASTIFAFVNPAAKKKKNADGSISNDTDDSGKAMLSKKGQPLTPETASPEEILALKQRLFAHLRETEGSAPDTLGDLLDSIETFMNGRIAKALFSEDELNVLRSASYDDKETLKLATTTPPSDAELYELARKALACPNMDAAQNAEAIRFRIDYELRDFKKKMQASREWLPNGPVDPFARAKWQQLCLEKHQNPSLQEVRDEWEFDTEGGCVKGECGPLIGPDGQYVTIENRQKVFGSNPHAPNETVGELNPNHPINFDKSTQQQKTAKLDPTRPGGSKYIAQPPFFEAYFFKLRVRRTLFHRGGGFHLVYGIIRGRFLYYFPECWAHHIALGGAYLFGAKIERTSMGVRQYCLRISLAVQRKESKSAADPEENEIMMCFDTESELMAWHDQLLRAALPDMGPTLKQYFGQSQLSRFVQDSQLVEIVELDRKAEEALQKSRTLFSIGSFSIGGQSPTTTGAVTSSNFTFHNNNPNSPLGSPRSGAPRSTAFAGPPGSTELVQSGSIVTHFANANVAQLQLQQRGLVQREPAKYRARAIMLALSASLGINPTQSAQISRKATNLRVGELEGGLFSPNEQRAIDVLAADLTISHYHYGGRKTYILGAGFKTFGQSSPSERLLMPIIPRPLTPAYEKAQTAYAVLAAISAFMPESPKRLSDIGSPATGIRITSVHNARELKKYFRTTTIAPANAPFAASFASSSSAGAGAASPPQSALKGSKSNAMSKKEKEAAALLASQQPQSRLWLADVMGGTIQLIDIKGSKAHVYEDRQLVRMERSSVDPVLLHMTFFNNGHHMFAENFATPESREEFCCLVETMKVSGRVYCPPFAAPAPNNYSMLYTIPGEKVQVVPFADAAAEPLTIEGEGQVRASKDPIQKVSVWTGTLNVTGFPIHNPDALEKWIPLDEEHGIYCVCLQEASYRRGEQQLFSYLQRYFEEPNPAVNSVIIAPKRYVELTAKEMGDKDWQNIMLAAKDSVTANHNALVLPQQKRVMKLDSELKKLIYDEEVRNKPRYRLVAKVGLFDIQLCVFARVNHWLACSNIETTTHALSSPCYSGERGAVAAAFDLNGTSFCFAGVHLPGLRTPEQDAVRRCLSHEVLSGLSFGNRSVNADITNQFDFFFALGDFNAPLRNAGRRTIMHLHEAQAKKAMSDFVAENCLLQREMAIDPQALMQELHDAAEAAAAAAAGEKPSAAAAHHGINLFTLLSGKTKDLVYSDDGHLLNSGLILSGFREPTINFMPTHCIDIATGKYNLAKVIGPNYPDRILVKVPVYCPPVLDADGRIEKLIELEDDTLAEEDEEDEEENEDDKLKKLITLEDDDEGEEAQKKKTAAEEGEDEEEEEEEDEEDDDDDEEEDDFGGGGAAKKAKSGSAVPTATSPSPAAAAAKDENAKKKAEIAAPQTEDIGAAVYPIVCTSYTSNTQLRVSEHFPVNATFTCNVPRPIGFIFMSNCRRAIVTLTDLRVVGVVFPFAKHAVFTGGNRNEGGGIQRPAENEEGGPYGETASPPTSPRRVRIIEAGAAVPASPTLGAQAKQAIVSAAGKYRPVEDAQSSSLTLQISVNNHYLNPPLGIISANYNINRFSSTLQDTASASVAPPCKFTALFPKEVQMKMGIPTTPEHFMHSNMSFIVFDQNDPDVFRGRRGATRMSMMNFAGPVDGYVQKAMRGEMAWDLLQVPFKCPLEIAGSRMGCMTGSMTVSYERLNDYVEGE